ncbi:hypothetical protein [Bradyrhizobium sp. LHD-71]|uniref:hypothetical protein n=1 Tax=Bradyrhizobium sp. LHD-71 TaxID=3072141 RepID=UPI00280ED305|nr:hypothetical protein [Bradyrhizobium sp. LHD-71]MDQ8726683.1 hypothetical protein [Bradyrhizobium sp. LHD-71]
MATNDSDKRFREENINMSMRSYSISIGAVALIACVSALPAPANALSMQECSTKYRAAKSAGNLGGMKWNDFRKAECEGNAAAAPSAPAAASPGTTGAAPSAGTSAAPAPSPSSRSSYNRSAPTYSGPAVFPATLSQKFASESAGKARMHTCLEQYKANKATGGNGGLEWIQKGGGYYSECNKRLSQNQ